MCLFLFTVRRVWRYQRGNQNPYIEEKQTTQWPNEKVQKDKQRSTKHTHKTKDRVTRTPTKNRGWTQVLNFKWGYYIYICVQWNCAIRTLVSSWYIHYWSVSKGWWRGGGWMYLIIRNYFVLLDGKYLHLALVIVTF